MERKTCPSRKQVFLLSWRRSNPIQLVTGTLTPDLLAKISTSASQPADGLMPNCCLAGGSNAIGSCQQQQQQKKKKNSMSCSDVRTRNEPEPEEPNGTQAEKLSYRGSVGPSCSPDEGPVWQRARPTSSLTRGPFSGSLRHSAPTLLHFCQPEVLSAPSLLLPAAFLFWRGLGGGGKES